MKRLATTFAVTIASTLALAGIARGDTTLGSTSIPSPSTGARCQPDSVFFQDGSDPSTPFTVPTAGTITQWRVNTIDAAPATPVTLVVLRPGTGSMTVVGVDPRTLPDPLAAGDNVVAFSPPTPLAVQTGDALGLYTGNVTFNCEWNGAGVPAAYTLAAVDAPSPPATDQTLPVVAHSGSGYRMNLAATLAPPSPPAPGTKKKCKKRHKKHKRSAESAKKKKCKKRKKR
jgi:hypothetical protein